jgi:hypothetical protein
MIEPLRGCVIVIKVEAGTGSAGEMGAFGNVAQDVVRKKRAVDK